MDLQKSLKSQCGVAPKTVNNDGCLQQKMIELLIELNESSAKHCNLVKSLQSMEDELRGSVSTFHNLLLDIGNLERENSNVLTEVEREAIFSAAKAFKFSFIYHRAVETNRARLCNMIFDIEKLERDTLPRECNDSNAHSQTNSPVSKTLDDEGNTGSQNVRSEGSILQKSDNVDVCVVNEQSQDIGSTIDDSAGGNAVTNASSNGGVSINEDDDIMIVYDSKTSGQLSNGAPNTVIEIPSPPLKRRKNSKSVTGQDVTTAPRSQCTQLENQRIGFIAQATPGNRNVVHMKAGKLNRNTLLARGMTVNQLPMTGIRRMLPMIHPYAFFNPTLTEWGPGRNQNVDPNNLSKGNAIPKNPFGGRC